MTVCLRLLVVLALLAGQASGAAPTKPARAIPFPLRKIRSLDVQPSPIRLGSANRRQQVRIVAIQADGKRWDATHHLEMTVADPKIAEVRDSAIYLRADGATELVVRAGRIVRRVPVEVRGADRFPAVHFENDILPLLSKLGCNSGGCHGKQSGQNGFKLSVFGFDPQADYGALVHEGRGRRVFPAAPKRSLLVRKAVGEAPHGGGARCQPDSLDARWLTEWIRQGTPRGAPTAPRLKGIRISPAEIVTRPRADHQVLITALYSDGSRRDVTAAAGYSGNADRIAAADAAGRIRTGSLPGEAAITVNYQGHVGAVRVIVPQSLPKEFKTPRINNPIDRYVWDKLRKMGIQPSPPCDDATFLRRLHLDLLGSLPAIAEVRRFLADTDPQKRNRAIDAALKRREYADVWAQRWADVLLVDRNALGDRGAFQFHSWLREQMAANRPYNEWVAELIVASGNSGKYGPVNFYRALRTPEELTRSVSQAFLGVRLDCAQCHHHPFEKWSQEDFYGLSGFFQNLKRIKTPGNRELVYHAGRQPVKMPLTGAPVDTRPPDGPVLPPDARRDPRRFLARWLTADKNPWFARVAVNRLWKHLLGRGLVEPEDDLRTTNPAVNEPLLDYLAQEFVRSGFDQKQILRLITQSQVYQRSSQALPGNQDDEQNFSHYYVKRMPAEVLLDAISQVTGVPESFSGRPLGTRAIELWDNRLPSYFLDTFGRSARESPCQCAKSSAPTMAQALHLMNAPEIDAKIQARQGLVARTLQTEADNRRVLETFALAALGRLPNAKERRAAERLFSTSESRRAAAEDLLWTLLNSYDFLFIR